MGQRRSTHERPKGQILAIRQAMADNNITKDDTVEVLLDAVERAVLDEVLGKRDTP